MKRLLLLLFLLFPAVLQAHAINHPLKVIATFSILGDFASIVGGNQVQVYSLVGPDTTPYGYKPSPGDLMSVERSDLVVANGLGLEGWLAQLLQDSRESVQVLNATKNVQPRYGVDGGIDPHAWLNVAHAEVYVQNIRDALVATDPINAQYYKDNAAAYLLQLRKLDHWIKLQMGRVPVKQRKFATPHDAFAYFGAAYGVSVLPLGKLQPDEEASANDFPEALAQIKKNHIPLFTENVGNPRLMEEAAQLSGEEVAGKLYSEALSSDSEGAHYIDLMKANTQRLFEAFQAGKK